MTHQRNEFTRQELLSSRLAAGALVVLSLAFATAARAEAVSRFTTTHVAKVTPLKGVSTENVQTAAAQPAAPINTAATPNLALEQLGMGDMVRITVFRNPDL